jgi:hypothetical protein
MPPLSGFSQLGCGGVRHAQARRRARRWSRRGPRRNRCAKSPHADCRRGGGRAVSQRTGQPLDRGALRLGQQVGQQVSSKRPRPKWGMSRGLQVCPHELRASGKLGKSHDVPGSAEVPRFQKPQRCSGCTPIFAATWDGGERA